MSSSWRALLASHYRIKLLANSLYVYGIHMVHVVLNLLPGFIRNPAFRLMLKRVGRGTYFDYNVYVKFPWLVEIGSGCSINRGVEFYADFVNRHGITLGDNVRIAPHVRFHAGGHDVNDLSYAHTGGNITVADNVWIGAGAIILPGVTIGARSIVGAGSVVTKDIPEDVIAAGIPARVIRARSFSEEDGF